MFVCLSLLEAAVISFMGSKSGKTKTSTDVCSYNDNVASVKFKDDFKYADADLPERFHRTSRFVFPALFLIFNVIYFAFYMYLQ